MAQQFDIAASGFAVREAILPEAKACRMLLPHFDPAGFYLVAVEQRTGLVVGAAALTQSRRAKPPIGPGVAIHVIPPCRRQGIGRALVTALLDAAQRSDDQSLYSARKVDLADDELPAWQGLGFHAIETVEEHELALKDLLPRLAPLVAWMRETNHIPPEARIVPLYAANRAHVLELHLDHLGGDRGDVYQRLRGLGSSAFHPRYSRVLLLGERVVGCLLAHRVEQDAAVVDAVIVAPELRNGWASVWLKLEAGQGAEPLGVRRFQFTSFDHYEDTRRFTERLGGVVTRRWGLRARLIEPSAVIE